MLVKSSVGAHEGNTANGHQTIKQARQASKQEKKQASKQATKQTSKQANQENKKRRPATLNTKIFWMFEQVGMDMIGVFVVRGACPNRSAGELGAWYISLLA